MALQADLINRTMTLLGNLETNRATELPFVNGGWLTDPSKLSERSAEYWSAFLAVIMANNAELSRWVSPIVVASGMQVLMTRFVYLWQALPPNPSLHPDLQAAVYADIPRFVTLVVI